jgi:uncharacterized protein (DUF1330 family)
MSAYILVRITVSDPERYPDYTAQTPALIAKHGGKFIVRGGATSTLEGPEEGRRIVVIEFPSRVAAEAFYNDPDYAPVRAIRWEAADSEMIVVDGV